MNKLIPKHQSKSPIKYNFKNFDINSYTNDKLGLNGQQRTSTVGTTQQRNQQQQAARQATINQLNQRAQKIHNYADEITRLKRTTGKEIMNPKTGEIGIVKTTSQAPVKAPMEQISPEFDALMLFSKPAQTAMNEIISGVKQLGNISKNYRAYQFAKALDKDSKIVNGELSDLPFMQRITKEGKQYALQRMQGKKDLLKEQIINNQVFDVYNSDGIIQSGRLITQQPRMSYQFISPRKSTKIDSTYGQNSINNKVWWNEDTPFYNEGYNTMSIPINSIETQKVPGHFSQAVRVSDQIALPKSTIYSFNDPITRFQIPQSHSILIK